VLFVDNVHPLSDHVHDRDHLHVKVLVVPVQRDCLHECVRFPHEAINFPGYGLNLLRNIRLKHFQTSEQRLGLTARLVCLVNDFIHLNPVGLQLQVNLPQGRELQVRPLLDFIKSPCQVFSRDIALHCSTELIKSLVDLSNLL
jgi:hypothetical protein